MYIETRTSADEVKATLLQELEYMANNLLNQPQSVSGHPSFYTVKGLERDGSEFVGAVSLARKVYGDLFVLSFENKITEAMEANQRALKIKRG